MPESTHRDLTQTTFDIAFIVILAGACLWIFSPFLPATIWAAMIVIAAWPLMLELQRRMGGRRIWAVAAMMVGLLMILVVPLTFGAVALIAHADEARQLVISLSTGILPPPPAWLKDVPLVGTKAVEAWAEATAGGASSLMARVAPYLGMVVQWFIAQLGGFGMLVVQFFLTVVISAILFFSGEEAAAGLLQFGRRVAGKQGENSMILASKAIRGIALGVVGTALAQTAAGAIGLAVAGVPAAPLLSVLMFVLCIAQLGPFLILLPSVAWLFWSGENLTGSLLLVWSLLVGTMDNFLRPMLIKRGVDLPLLLIMSGVMGGLVAFGLVGIFAGPVILAVSYTLLTDWVGQGTEAQP